MGIPPVVDSSLEAVEINSSRTTQALDGASLRIIYLAKRASCQLVGEDTP